MSALDDVRRALTAAYGTDEIFDSLTVDDLIRALVADEQLAVNAELRDAAEQIGGRAHHGGPRAKGFRAAAGMLFDRIDGVVPKPPKRANHAETAARMRAEPGVWMPVADYPSRRSATSIAWHIRKGAGRLHAYQPTGTFETRLEPTPRATRVLARFVGTARKDSSL